MQDPSSQIHSVLKNLFPQNAWRHVTTKGFLVFLAFILSGCALLDVSGAAQQPPAGAGSDLPEKPTATAGVQNTPRPSATAFRPTLYTTVHPPASATPTRLIQIASPTPVPSPTSTRRPLPPAESGTIERGFSWSGLNRTYLLHIPLGYTPANDYPLLIVLHGKGNSGRVMMELSDFNDLADKAGFLVVYPNALGNPTVWNTGFNSDTRALTDDIGFIKTLISRLESELAVDARRIYLAGFSNGAIMTYRYAIEPDNRLAAIAAVAGTVGVYTTGYKKDFMALPARPLPVLSIFGGDDIGIPLVGEAVPTTPLLSVTDTVQFWVQANGCRPGSQRTTSPDGKVIKDVFLGCRSGADVVSFILKDSGHVWPELARDKLSASQAIWEFLARYSLP